MKIGFGPAAHSEVHQEGGVANTEGCGHKRHADKKATGESMKTAERSMTGIED